MSTSFLFNFATSVLSNKSIHFSESKLIGSLTLLVPHGAYVFMTKNEKDMLVTAKYKFSKHGYEQFMIVDNENNHYCVNNSLWFWRWNAIEDWHSINISKNYKFWYYGWRWPVFGMFPNIYSQK